MADGEIYADLVQPKGRGYNESDVIARSHYHDPIDRAPGRAAGHSRIWGDASPEVQSQGIDTLIAASERAGLTPRQTAHVLAIARAESGFNPDAAAGPTTAFGLGQFVDRTGAGYGLNSSNSGDLNKQAEALVAHYVDNAALAARRGQDEDHIYRYHHDGPSLDYGGLGIGREKVTPYIDEYERFVRDHQQKRGFVASEEPAAPTAVGRGTGSGGSRDALADGVLRQGESGPAVRALQEELIRQGYTDAEGKPLAADGRFGERTRQAVEAYQQANGLDRDGIAGPDTLSSLKRTEPDPKPPEQPAAQPLLSDRAHPDNAMFVQAVEGLEKLGVNGGFKNREEMERAAASLVHEAKVSGMERIDQVVASTDGKRLFAIEGDSSRGEGFYQRVMMDRDQAAARSVAETTQALAQDVPARTPDQPGAAQPQQARPMQV